MVHTALGYAKASAPPATLACTGLDRPGRDEHAHRRGDGDDQPPARAAAARRHVRQPPAGTGAPAARAPARGRRRPSTTRSAPLSRFFDRIARPEQLLTALPQAMRVLLDPAETGAVTIALHQDVQGEAFDYPARFFAPRIWRRAPAPAGGQ